MVLAYLNSSSTCLPSCPPSCPVLHLHLPFLHLFLMHGFLNLLTGQRHHVARLHEPASTAHLGATHRGSNTSPTECPAHSMGCPHVSKIFPDPYHPVILYRFVRRASDLQKRSYESQPTCSHWKVGQVMVSSPKTEAA